MKNWKCIIGATLLTLVCAALAVGVLVGFCWLIDNFLTMQYVIFVIPGIICLVVIAGGWLALFDHCKKWQKKGVAL